VDPATDKHGPPGQRIQGYEVYGLTKDTNLSFVVGCELLQICFGAYQLVFSFSQGVTISVESRCDAISDGDVLFAAWRPSEFDSIAALGKLLGERIVSYEIREHGTLMLTFEREERILIFDSNKEAESYQITAKHQTVVV
jgi:hypothetical protein